MGNRTGPGVTSPAGGLPRGHAIMQTANAAQRREVKELTALTRLPTRSTSAIALAGEITRLRRCLGFARHGPRSASRPACVCSAFAPVAGSDSSTERDRADDGGNDPGVHCLARQGRFRPRGIDLALGRHSGDAGPCKTLQ